jgi:7-cyano-7-deazaguanine synthase
VHGNKVHRNEVFKLNIVNAIIMSTNTQENQTSENKQKKAVILFSGGLDSTTVLAMAQAQGFDCYCLSFDYGQRHNSELAASKRIAEAAGATHKIVSLDLRTIGGSALTADIDVPDATDVEDAGIPVTYVPARNTVFLSVALGWAEVLGANDIFVGVNAVDYSGYPDCRPQFIEAFEALANVATKAGVEGNKMSIQAPLIDLTKAEIVQTGHKLGVDYSQTVSCYQADDQGRACGKCDSCALRKQGFDDASVVDPTVYANL